jgi:O-antigen ligase/polysaccharide polymerase Wzy-like membrane protein
VPLVTMGAPAVFGRRAPAVRPAVDRFLVGKGGDRLQSALVGLGVLVLSLLAGAAVLDPRWSVLVVPAIGLSILVGIAAVSRGALVGFTLLGVLNGIPGLDLEAFAVPGSFRPSDLLIAFLIGVLVLWQFTTPADQLVDSRWLALTRTWAFIFVAWWLVTLARSVFFSDIPPLHAALFGRDFLYFALLLPLLPVALRRRSDIVTLVAVVGASAAIFSVAQTATSLFPSVAGVLDFSVLINPTLTNELEGLTRIYSYMGDVVVAGAIIAAGTAILARTSRLRLGAAALFVLLTVGALAQFSRASYASMLAGFLVLVGIAIFRAPAPMVVARKVVPALILLAALIPTLGLVHPTADSSQSAAQVFAKRAESGIEEIQARSGTFGYRYNIQSKMLDVVGNRWPVGVGFWHPDDRFVSGLPDGSIRNGDVGVLNGITTIGAVGTALLFLPVLGTILFLWRRRRTGSEEWDGFIFGASGWLFGVAVASISLVTLFSVQGLLLTAVVIVAAASVASLPPEPGGSKLRART